VHAAREWRTALHCNQQHVTCKNLCPLHLNFFRALTQLCVGVSRHHFSACSYNVSANIYTSAILKKQTPFSKQWTPQLHPLNPLYWKIWRPRCTLYFICVSPESLTSGPGCSRGEPHSAPLHPIHKLLPAAWGPLFKKGQTCLSPVLHLPKIALPIHPFITPLVTNPRHG